MRYPLVAVVCLIPLTGHVPVVAAQTTTPIKTALVVKRSDAPADNSGELAQEPSTTKPESVYDRIWRFREWYRDEDNGVIQRLRFRGRYQQDFATVDADQGEHEEWNVRRLRMGLQAYMFGSLLLHAEVDLNPQEADPVYVRFTDMYAEWSTRPELVVTVGKQSIPYTMDGATSSRDLIAIDRGALANNLWFTEEYLPGASISGTSEPWVYFVGAYSAGARNKELGEFSGGAVTLGSLGYDFAKSMDAREALASVNYVYQNPDPDNTFTRQFHHIISMNLKLERSRWGLRTDLSAASGYYSQSNVWGVMVMPFVNITPKLQAVGRYEFLDSKDPNGIRLGAYEDRVASGRGDQYQDVYFGANYYFYGHQLKVQTGVQFGDLQDRANDGGAYSGVSWVTGLRVGW
jgi:phosphate-selective porin OprO/OprP